MLYYASLNYYKIIYENQYTSFNCIQNKPQYFLFSTISASYHPRKLPLNLLIVFRDLHFKEVSKLIISLFLEKK